MQAATANQSDVVMNPPAAQARRSGLIHQYMELGKARLTALVVVTAGVGYVMGARGEINWLTLFWLIIGTALAAVGAAAFNQLLEIDRDCLMKRTANRPLPSGQMSRTHAVIVAFGSSAGGLAILCPLVNGVVCTLAFINILVYVVIYTPMKPKTSLNTLIGAICGAIPPMMGWAAATGTLDLGAWLLGAILFVWQIPHFLALAWLYRDEYAKGGFKMLPMIDPTGRLTCTSIILYTLVLLPLGLMVTLAGISGWVFAGGSLVLGLAWLWLGFRLMRDKTRVNARHVFLASITYLPLLLTLMMVDGNFSRNDSAGHEIKVMISE